MQLLSFFLALALLETADGVDTTIGNPARTPFRLPGIPASFYFPIRPPPTYTSIQLAIAFLKVYEKLLVDQWPQLMLK